MTRPSAQGSTELCSGHTSWETLGPVPDEEWESIGKMETYETVEGNVVAYDFALSRLYSSKYDKENRMKQLFIDSIESNN